MNKQKVKYISCIFIKEGIERPENSPRQGVLNHTLESGIEYIKGLKSQGINHFLIFGVPLKKDISIACSPNGIVAQFLTYAKKEFGESVILIADVGLSPYSPNGHSAVMSSNGINEKESYNKASKLAVAFANAGADQVAPCLSLHEQVEKIRKALDFAGQSKVKILAYSAKFSSSLYGPFRSTIKSVLKAEDKKSYQTDYSNSEDALKQILSDELQGADAVMVKPGMCYLDILYRARTLTMLPLAVYHVSGEYMMLKLAGLTGALDEKESFDEVHSAFQRAGADFIIGYAPEHFLRWKNKGK